MISRRSLLSQLGVLALGGAGVWYLRDRVLWRDPTIELAPEAQSSGWLSFSDDEPRVLVVDVQLAGAPARALIDSGAQSSVVDRSFADRLELGPYSIAPVVAFGVSGGPQAGRATSIDVAVGELVFRGVRAAVLELAGISQISGRGFDLILGQDALRQVVLDIDFPRSRLALHPPGYSPPEGAEPSPARLSGREVLVPVIVESEPLEVVLDTGASGALALSAEVAAAAGLLDGRPVGTSRSITFGGLSQGRVVRARTLAFAGLTFEDVPVHIYDPARGAPIPDGLLGIAALSSFRMILDQARGRLHLLAGPPEPPRRRRAPARARV